MTTRDAGGTARTQPPQGPSFIRRHPILAAFGMLAALSLFAAYWPVSAIVTGVIVGARASGMDRRAYGLLRRGAAAVSRRLHRAPDKATEPPAGRGAEPPARSGPAAPAPGPGTPSPAPQAPSPLQPVAPRVRRSAARIADHGGRRRQRAEPAERAAALKERELGV